MRRSDIIRLAWESLQVNKLRTGLTMLGMIIGVGSVVLLVSIGTGARNYITNEFESLGTNLILVQPGKNDSRSSMGPPVGSSKKKITLQDVDAIEKRAVQVEAVTGVMFGLGTIRAEGKSINMHILGSNERLIEILNIRVGQGSFFSKEEDEAGRRVAVLGWAIAQKLFGDETALGKLVRLNEVEHRVVGIVKKTGDVLGWNIDEVVFIPNRSAMRIFNEDKLFGIRARAKSKSAMSMAIEEISQILTERRNGQDDFTIITQDSMLDTMNTILNMLTYVLAGIAMISTLVGGIGIMNIMLVSVTERTREIGIRRAVGARQSDILKQFLTESVALSLAGGLVGLIGSVGLTYVIWLVNARFDMRAPVWIAFPAFFMSVLTGVGFGVWPARRAARIETIEALRHE